MLAPTCRLEPSTSKGGSISAGDPLGDRHGELDVGPGQQDGELVATQPHHDVARPGDAGQPGPDESEEPVAGRVPEGVVDLLEVVEVDHEQGQGLVAAPRGRGGWRRWRRARWVRRRRLPRPVSSSVTAWWWLARVRAWSSLRDRAARTPTRARVATVRPSATELMCIQLPAKMMTTAAVAATAGRTNPGALGLVVGPAGTDPLPDGERQQEQRRHPAGVEDGARLVGAGGVLEQVDGVPDGQDQAPGDER